MFLKGVDYWNVTLLQNGTRLETYPTLADAGFNFTITPDGIESSISLYPGLRYDLSPPPLDIWYGGDPRNGAQMEWFISAQTKNGWDLPPNQTAVSVSWAIARGTCQPTSEYKWGFSAQMLVLMLALTLVYSALMVTLYWIVHDHGRADQYEGHISDKVFEYSAEELDERIQKGDPRITIDASGLPPSRWDEAEARKRQRRGARRRAREDVKVQVKSQLSSAKEEIAGDATADVESRLLGQN